MFLSFKVTKIMLMGMAVIWLFVIGFVEYLTGRSLGGLLAPLYSFLVGLVKQIFKV